MKTSILRLSPVLLLALAGSWFLFSDSYDESPVGSRHASCVVKNNGKIPKLERRPNEWFYEQRAFPFEQIPAGKHQEAVLEAREMRAIHYRSATEEPVWEPAGPTNIPGRVTDLAVDPTDDSTVYVASASGGLFKTIDFGQNWIPVLDEQGAFPTGAVAVHPTNPSIVYVGTGEGNPATGPHEGSGIYKSVDAGATWSCVGLPNSRRIARIIIDPVYPDTVYVAVYGAYFETISAERGIYRTLDGGSTWDHILYPNPAMGCVDLAFHPSSGVLLAAAWEYRGPQGSNIWRSSDRGDTWTNISDESVGLPPTSPSMGRIGVTMDPVTGISYALLASADGVFHSLYKSSDTGATWAQTNDASLGTLNGSWAGGFYFGNIRVAPGAPDRVYPLGLNAWRSTNGGSNWVVLDNGDRVHVDQHAMHIDPSNPDNLLLGNDGGVYYSRDGGDTWDTLANMPNDQFYAINIDHRNPTRLIGGTQDNGTLITSTGNLDEWQFICGGDGMYCMIDHSNPDIIYASAQGGYFLKSIDNGANFALVMNGILSYDRKGWCTPVIMDPNDPQVLYYGSSRVYRSTDGAHQWTDISDHLAFEGVITTIDVSRTDPDVIYVGTDQGLVWNTTDGGQNWSMIIDGLPLRYVTRVTIDHHNPAVGYVTHSGYKSEGDWSPHVHRTDDFGNTWVPIDGNLPDAPVNDIIVDYYNDSTLYVGNDVGVFVSRDLGTTWAPFGSGMPLVTVQDMVYDIATRTLVAGTYGRSMYRTIAPCDDTTDSDSDGVPDDCDNCPLAFNPVQEDTDYDLVGDACDECTDSDGDSAGDPGFAANTCPEDNCPLTPNPSQADTDGDGIGDLCDIRPTSWDTVSTTCLSLTVGNNGNYGHQRDSVSMDFALSGDCDPEAIRYIFDGSTVITYDNGSEIIAGHSLYNNQTFTLVDNHALTIPSETTTEYERYETGTMIPQDSTVALEVTWWAPRQNENCRFIIKKTRVYSHDGNAHSGLYVGDAVDFDIPSDAGMGNASGCVPTSNLIYQQGRELSGGCQSNAERFGGLALLGWYLGDDTCSIDTTQPFGAYSRLSTTYMLPSGGPVPSELHAHMSAPGFDPYEYSGDLYSVMTYVGDLTLQPDDTLTVYSMLSTIHIGEFDSLESEVVRARQWIRQLLHEGCSCCGAYTNGFTGNVNNSTDGKITLSDITALIDCVYISQQPLDCPEDGNVNGSEDNKITLSDITQLIDHVYISRAPTSACR